MDETSLDVVEIEYSELRTFGFHNNRRVAVRVQVRKDQDPQDVIRRARHFVWKELWNAGHDTSFPEDARDPRDDPDFEVADGG